MIDLRGIARRLHLSVDQLRLAADLLEQGYHPGFIQRYRADETGGLPTNVLWELKLEVDRQQRLEQARAKAHRQLPKDAELDEEAQRSLERAITEAEIEATLRCFRARRHLEQSPDKASVASTLLEKMISLTGDTPSDLQAFAAEQLQIDAEAAGQTLEQVKRLIGSILHGDTNLNLKLRRAIQSKAQISVEELEAQTSQAGGNQSSSAGEKHDGGEKHDSAEPTAESDGAGKPTDAASQAEGGQAKESEAAASPPATQSESSETTETTETHQTSSTDVAEQGVKLEQSHVESSPTAGETGQDGSTAADLIEKPAQSEATTVPSEAANQPTTPASPDSAVDPNSGQSDGNSSAGAESESSSSAAENTHESGSSESQGITFSEGKSKRKKKGGSKSQLVSKSLAKLTPRQRRRRWLTGMLQPMKSLKCPLSKLTAYQQLMLGRGRRSQLVNTNLKYPEQELVSIARDAFVSPKHGLAKWFEEVVSEQFNASLKAKIELDALSHLEEIAQEKLLESAVDRLRSHLVRRPVRGHVIMLVDTVGPKSVGVAIVDPDGKVLATDEISCSAQPDVVSQNVVRLGELAHRFRVTLVALTNGPARRFLIVTLRELMKQSFSSGLRWTMADRSGAEAYAAGRIALKELSAHNRRDRAAIWIARSLQDPIGELLKVDINRLRLGSYQRELPQEPLKKLVRETIADCLSGRGVDIARAAVDELQCVPGVAEEQAQQISALAPNEINSRQDLMAKVVQWPENEARQAMGFLRVFGSEQPLDATLIHPDDYRLAERLISNTELSAPPSAPPGWEKPVADEAGEVASEATVQAEAKTSEGEAGSVTSEPVQSGTDEAAAEAETSTSDLPAVKSDTEAADSEATSPDVKANEVSAAGSAEDGPQDTAASGDEEDKPAADGADSQPAKEGAEPQATDSSSQAESDSPEQSEAATDAASASSTTSRLDPEYSEKVTSEQVKQLPIDVEKVARGWQVGREKLRWVASCLQDPFKNPHLANMPVPMLAELPTLSTIEPGMCLWAVVVGVADFGAFVELGPDCSGLIHISRLSPSYVEDPHQVVQVGDLVMVWVVSIDEKKNRVALTALSPADRAAAEEAAAEHRERRRGPQGGRDDRGRSHSRKGDGARRQDSRGGRSGGGQRDSRGGGRPRGGRHGGRGHDSRRRSSQPVVVKSKKPVAPISDAMKGGDEPLRSFSDLMQFYESKRTDEPAAPSGEKQESAPEAATNDAAEQAAAEASAVQEVKASGDEAEAVTKATQSESPATPKAPDGADSSSQNAAESAPDKPSAD